MCPPNCPPSEDYWLRLIAVNEWISKDVTISFHLSIHSSMKSKTHFIRKKEQIERSRVPYVNDNGHCSSCLE